MTEPTPQQASEVQDRGGDGGSEAREGSGGNVESLISSLPTRWEIELEFVQSLCNIQYLNYLAQQGHLQDPNFINYLSYLNYWKKPEYAKYLVYPNCLHILTLLQSENFRKEIVNPEFRNNLMNDMVKNWQSQESNLDSNELQPEQNEMQPLQTKIENKSVSSVP